MSDGAVGFCSALEEIYPNAIQQRCYIDKTANILDMLLSAFSQVENDPRDVLLFHKRKSTKVL